MSNVEMKPIKLSTWRKIALGSWHDGGDPSVYGALDFDATRLLAHRKRWTERTGAKPPTITTIVSKAVAMTLHEHPDINGMIRWGRIYRRKTVTLFIQTAVDDAGKDLSGVLVREAEHKTLQQLAEEIATGARAIRSGRDPNLKRAKSTFGRFPAFLMRHALNFMGFVLYTLNLDLRWAGLPKDPFGSVMITSIGSIGLDEAFAPLIAYSRVPLLIALGAVRERPAVVEGQLAIQPMFKMCVTFDHRFIDGIHAAKMVKTVRRILETDEGLDELGLV